MPPRQYRDIVMVRACVSRAVGPRYPIGPSVGKAQGLRREPQLSAAMATSDPPSPAEQFVVLKALLAEEEMKAGETWCV